MRRNGRDLQLDPLFRQIGARDVGINGHRPSPHPDAIEIIDDLGLPDAHLGIVGLEQIGAQGLGEIIQGKRIELVAGDEIEVFAISKRSVAEAEGSSALKGDVSKQVVPPKRPDNFVMDDFLFDDGRKPGAIDLAGDITRKLLKVNQHPLHPNR